MSRHERALERLAALLRERPMTGVEIARVMRCCKPAAYQRVQALVERGEPVFTITERRNRPGPRARAFGIR